jgi:hypothetical protein
MSANGFVRPLAVAIAICLSLTACGERQKKHPPNTTITGTVKEIRKTSRQPPFPVLFYMIMVETPDGRHWYGNTDAASEDALQQIIDETVTFTCYRKDLSITTCTERLVSLMWNGTDLINVE